jgi:hypothetical protein
LRVAAKRDEPKAVARSHATLPGDPIEGDRSMIARLFALVCFRLLQCAGCALGAGEKLEVDLIRRMAGKASKVISSMSLKSLA